jgi:hypothetical protein
MRTGRMREAITSPKYDGKWGWARAQRAFDHTRRIVEAAEIEEPIAWPFTYDVIIKSTAAQPIVGRSWRERKAIAEGELRRALPVPDPKAAAGRRILIVDDVFTEGFTIREVARALNLAGATEVSEIVLAREPWKGSPHRSEPRVTEVGDGVRVVPGVRATGDDHDRPAALLTVARRRASAKKHHVVRSMLILTPCQVLLSLSWIKSASPTTRSGRTARRTSCSAACAASAQCTGARASPSRLRTPASGR